MWPPAAPSLFHHQNDRRYRIRNPDLRRRPADTPLSSLDDADVWPGNHAGDAAGRDDSPNG